MAITIPTQPAKGSTDFAAIYAYEKAIDGAVRELQEDGVPSALVGYLRADDPQWDLTPYDHSATTPVVNDFTNIINAAHSQRKKIIIDHRYLVGPTTGTVSNWNDKHLDIRGSGELLGAGGTIVRQQISPSPEVSLTAFKPMVVGGPDEKHTVSYASVAPDQVAKFAADMVWQIVASGATKSTTSDYRSGFYTWSLPGTAVHDLLATKVGGVAQKDTGKVVMAEAFEVLGASFLLNIAGSTLDPEVDSSLYEDDTLVGVTSGATMKIESNMPDYNGSSHRRLITRQVKGTFTTNENLKRGTKIVGKLVGDGVIVFKTKALYDWDVITATRVLRKLGGSVNGYTPTAASGKFPVGDYFSNLESRVEGISFSTVGDPDGVDQTRGAAIATYGAVGFNYSNIVFRKGYRNGFRLASPYGGKIQDCQVLSLANDAIQSEGAYGYGVEFEGTATNCLVIGCYFSNLRHGITTNPSGNSQFLSTVDGTLRHGIQRFIFVVDCHSYDTYAQGFDSHHGANDLFVINCTVNGVVGGGQKDSGVTGMGMRSGNTTYIGCMVFGATNAFNDPTAGYTVPNGNPDPNSTGTWPITPVHQQSIYINCIARGYEAVGFRQGLAAESKYHSALYVGCSADDGGQTAYDTVGWELTNVDTVIIDPRPGRNKLAMFNLEPGGYWTNGPKPTTPVKTTIAFVGDMFADFSRNVSNTTKLLRVTGHSTAGITRVAIAGNARVLQKAGQGAMPPSMVDVVGGKVILAAEVGARVVNINGSETIKTYTKATTATVTRANLPTSTWS